MSRPAELRIHASEIETIADEVSRFPRLETGGALYGLWSHGRSPTVLLATRPGKRAVRSRLHFRDDAEAHRLLEALLWRRFGIQCVGLWHSHHRLGLHELSSGDVHRTRRYAVRSGRSRFCEILGYFHLDQEVGVKPFVYSDAPGGLLMASSLVTLPGRSPIRQALGVQGGELASVLRVGRHSYRADDYLPKSPVDELIGAAEGVVDRYVPPSLHPSVTLEIADGKAILAMRRAKRQLQIWLAADQTVERWRVLRGGTTVAREKSAGPAEHVIAEALKALGAEEAQ